MPDGRARPSNQRRDALQKVGGHPRGRLWRTGGYARQGPQGHEQDAGGIERVFLSLFLDESQLPVPRCIALTEEWAQQNMPEAMPLPGYHTFYRKAKAVPYPVMVFVPHGREKNTMTCAAPTYAVNMRASTPTTSG